MVSAVLLAALFVIGKPAAAALGGLTVAMWEALAAAVVLFPFTVQAVRESSEFMGEFLVLGVIFTGLSGVIWWSSMAKLPIAVVSVIMYLEPASAVVWASLFLDESPQPLTWIGIALVIAGGLVAGSGAVGPAKIPASEPEAVA